MKFDFTDKIPQHLIDLVPVLISGSDTINFSNKEYLITDNEKSLFEIRYEQHCSPFKEANVIDIILAVGFEENFYLFNLIAKTNILRLKMDWYFGHQYFNDNYFYVKDATGLYCLDINGIIFWQNNNLAIDGVIINNFTENRIFGSGEWDPPGGWQEFILDKKTGACIK